MPNRLVHIHNAEPITVLSERRYEAVRMGRGISWSARLSPAEARHLAAVLIRAAAEAEPDALHHDCPVDGCGDVQDLSGIDDWPFHCIICGNPVGEDEPTHGGPSGGCEWNGGSA